MKGFFIDVTNNLLDPKHKGAMGPSVWEFMWCLDKITRIDEDGIGWVLGGKPINVEDIRKEIGGDEKTIRRNLERLQFHGYILKKRTPYGIIIKVAKAKKRFGRSDINARTDRAKMSDVIKTVSVDSNIKRKSSQTISRNGLSKSRMHDDIVPTDGEGNELPQRPPKGPRPEGKNKIALRLQIAFQKLAVKYLGTSPVMDMKGYKIVLYAINTGGLTEKQIMDLFDEWFKLGKSDEETIQITRALSAHQINGYKIRNNVKN